MSAQQAEAAAVMEAAAKFAAVETIDLGTYRVLSVPSGRQVISTKKFEDERRDAPERRQGTATFEELTSFIAWARRFADEDSVIFADVAGKAPKLTAVIDYHRKTAEGLPRFGQHRGVYTFPIADEWKRWTTLGELSQADFAELLEERIGDVLDPGSAGDGARGFAAELGFGLATPSALLTLAKGLSVHVEQKVTSAQNLSSGEMQLAFEETHRDAKGDLLKVPGGFLIAVPVFRGSDLYQVPVRLRYRLRSGVLTWKLSLHRVNEAFLDAVKGACSTAASATELPLFYGTPEV